jgi:hypothetical protein
MNSEKIFENYDEAQKYSFSVPWKLETCNVGESCWCRIILPTEKILYKDKVGDTNRISEFEYIIPDGSIDRETAEYVLELHNRSVAIYAGQKQRLAVLKELANLDRNDFTKVCAFVDKIVEDIEEILTEIGHEEALALTKDYMIDLINPDLLDFDKEET